MTTWLRITAYASDAGGPDAGAPGGWERDAADLMAVREGYRGGQWGRDPETGTCLAVTSWSSREALDAIADDLDGLHALRRTQGLSLVTTATLRLLTTRLSWSPEEWAETSGRRSRTWVRIAFYRPGDLDAAYLTDSTDETVFLLRGVAGFRVGYWGVDDRTGAMAAITYWADRAAIDAAAPQLADVHADRERHGLVSGPVVNAELLHVQMPAAAEPSAGATRRP